MLNADFFPTPPEVAALMLDPLDLRCRTVLEPSAGKGDLVRHCLARFAEEVVWCEKEPELQDMLTSIRGASPAHSYADFLQVHPADVSHIDLIVMNPPFSADEAHILHAWEIAPPGGQTIAPPVIVTFWCESYIPSDRIEDQRLRMLARFQGG